MRKWATFKPRRAIQLQEEMCPLEQWSICDVQTQELVIEEIHL